MIKNYGDDGDDDNDGDGHDDDDDDYNGEDDAAERYMMPFLCDSSSCHYHHQQYNSPVHNYQKNHVSPIEVTLKYWRSVMKCPCIALRYLYITKKNLYTLNMVKCCVLEVAFR